MFRKSLTAFFIILANFILLAHAVIPHHHHKTDICIANNVDNVAHDNCDTHNHKHENEGDACVLNQIVVIASQQIRFENKDFDCDDYQSQFDGIHAVLLNKSADKLCTLNSSSTKPPLLAFTYSLFAGNSLGLRAPPIS